MPSFIFTHAFIKKKTSWSISSWQQKKNWAYLDFCFVAGQSPPFVLIDLFATKTTIRRSHYCSYVVITQSLLARNMFHCEASYNTPNWQGAQERVMHVSDSRWCCFDCTTAALLWLCRTIHDNDCNRVVWHPINNVSSGQLNWTALQLSICHWSSKLMDCGKAWTCHDICSSFKSAKSP